MYSLAERGPAAPDGHLHKPADDGADGGKDGCEHVGGLNHAVTGKDAADNSHDQCEGAHGKRHGRGGKGNRLAGARGQKNADPAQTPADSEHPGKPNQEWTMWRRFR